MIYRWDSVIFHLAGRRSRSASYLGLAFEDLVSVGREAAIRAQQTWQPGGARLSAWIYLRVSGEMTDEMRRAARQLRDDPDGWDPDDELGEEFSGLVEIRRSLHYLQARLPEEDWAILWLRHAEDWAPREIADAWGLSAKTIRNRLTDARKRAGTILALGSMTTTGAAI